MLRVIASASLGAAVLAAATVTGTQAASSPLGVWINDEGRGGIEISQCGDKLCGKVVWLKDGKDAKGCGLQILGDLRPGGAGTWDGGWIYSPDNDRKYDVEVKPLDGDRLQVLGYAGIKLFGKSMIWTRAPEDIQRCATPTTEAAAKPSPVTGEPAGKDSVAKAAPPPAESKETAPSTREARKQDDKRAAPSSPNPAERQAPPADTNTAGQNTAPPPPAPRTAEKKPEKADKPSRTARAERDCVLKVPYVTITYPCDRD